MSKLLLKELRTWRANKAAEAEGDATPEAEEEGDAEAQEEAEEEAEAQVAEEEGDAVDNPVLEELCTLPDRLEQEWRRLQKQQQDMRDKRNAGPGGCSSRMCRDGVCQECNWRCLKHTKIAAPAAPAATKKAAAPAAPAMKKKVMKAMKKRGVVSASLVAQSIKVSDQL